MRRQALATLVLFTAGGVWFSTMAALRLPAAVDPHAMTVGCEEASCCTSRCYLDEHGVHHCVPKNNSSCSCGVSSQERDALSLPVLEAVILSVHARLQVDLFPTGKIASRSAPLRQSDTQVPTPPPRTNPPA